MARRLTEFQLKALKVLREHGPMMPSEFARKMWPDAEGWNRPCKCGPSGTTRGAGMRLAGGAALGKLRKRGWVGLSLRWGVRNEYVLTSEGRRVLEEEEASCE